MRIITGYMPATEGKATVAGFDVFEQPLEAKRRTGYLPETPPLYPDMTVREYLRFVAKIKGVRANVNDRVDAVMKKTWVADMADRHCGKLSKGYKQRVGLAQALIHEPEVLVLDEPTAGLDPKQIIETRQLIRELAGTHTIVLSTHILPEVAQTCQKVVIINKGKVVAIDTPRSADRTAARRGDDVRAGARARRPTCSARCSRSPASSASTSPKRATTSAASTSTAKRAPTCAATWPTRDRPRRLGPARAAADAHEPRRHLPQPDDRRARGARRSDLPSEAAAVTDGSGGGGQCVTPWPSPNAR